MHKNRSEIRENTRQLLALRRLNPTGLALLVLQKRVRRGKRWAQRNAPIGWHRNLIEPDTGRGGFRPQNCRNDESVLALMFESRADLANDDGFVTSWTVASHYGFTLNRLRALGFETQIHHKGCVGFSITNAMIDA